MPAAPGRQAGAAHNVGCQVPDPHRRARPMRKETMSGIWRSPELKPKVATQSPRKTTTSTPNIISELCRRTERNSREVSSSIHCENIFRRRDGGRSLEAGRNGVHAE